MDDNDLVERSVDFKTLELGFVAEDLVALLDVDLIERLVNLDTTELIFAGVDLATEDGFDLI